MDTRSPSAKRETATAEHAPTAKRPYQSPVLTQYGSVEDLVNAGVVGQVATVPSVLIDG